VAKILLANKADTALQNKVGETALHRAAALNHTDMAKLLLGNGADVSARDNNGNTC
ncbi:hypothetical protein SARC_14239, partial [Sphaeroforma arctica JP610]